MTTFRSSQSTIIGCAHTGPRQPYINVNGVYKAVQWAVEKGITLGTSATTFSPGETVTRAQAMTFLYRAAGNPAAGTANPFADVAAGAYYESAVLWAASQKITQGTAPAAFSPANPCTRAQIVTFLYRYLGK
jgi:hypothetical protein